MDGHAAAPRSIEEFQRGERAMSIELETLLRNIIMLFTMSLAR